MTINNPSRRPDDENNDDDGTTPPRPPSLYPHANPPSHTPGGQVPRPTSPGSSGRASVPPQGYVSAPGQGQAPVPGQFRPPAAPVRPLPGQPGAAGPGQPHQPGLAGPGQPHQARATGPGQPHQPGGPGGPGQPHQPGQPPQYTGQPPQGIPPQGQPPQAPHGQMPGQVPGPPQGTPGQQPQQAPYGQPPQGPPVYPPAAVAAQVLSAPRPAPATPQPGTYVVPVGPAGSASPTVAPPATPAIGAPPVAQPGLSQPVVPQQRVQQPGVVGQPGFGPAAAVAQPATQQAPGTTVQQPNRQANVAQAPEGAVADTAATSRIGGVAIVGTRTAEQAAQAAASAVAHAPAAPATAPRPARTPPPRPTHGTIYGGTGSVGTNGNGRVRSRRHLPTLRVGAHTASDGALALLGIPMPGSGMVLGYDLDSATASIRLFRPEPTRVALIGGEWAFHLLTLRALALGARVAIFTATPERWDGFGEWATGRTGRVATFPPDQTVIVPASSHEPALLLYDGGLTGVPSTTPLGPWQTRLTVLRQLTTYGVPTLQESSVVMTQRLSKAEADLISSTMRLSNEASAWMQTLTDDALAVLIGGEERFVRLTLADVEKQLGSPQR